MRAISDPDAPTEPQALIEPGRRGILGTQPKRVERASGRLENLSDQLPANPQLPVRRQDIEVTHPADAPRRGIRIDVEAAHPDHLPTHQGRKESLARTIKPIPPAGPLLGESTQEP